MPVTPLRTITPIAMSQGPQTNSPFKIPGVEQEGKFHTLLNNLLKESVNDTRVPVMVTEPTKIPKGPVAAVQKIVTELTRSEGRLNELVKIGITEKNLSNQQLLTMQASVYKATLAIDVVSKGVEQTTGGIKTLLQSQV